jgi:hypothetical protein
MDLSTREDCEAMMADLFAEGKGGVCFKKGVEKTLQKEMAAGSGVFGIQYSVCLHRRTVYRVLTADSGQLNDWVLRS